MKKGRIIFAAALLVFSAAACLASDWEPAGWSGGGCYTSASWHPHVPDRVYLTSDVAGVWQSDDAGQNWRPLNAGLGSVAVAFIEVSPSDEGFLAAGTEDGLFLYKGGSWKRLDTAEEPMRFVRPKQYRSAAFDPNHSGLLAAGGASGKIFLYDLSSGESLPLGSPFPAKTEITRLEYDANGPLRAGGTQGMAVYSNGRWKLEEGLKGEISDWTWTGDKLWVIAGGKIFSRAPREEWKAAPPAPKGSFFRIAADLRSPSRVVAAWNDEWKTGLVSGDCGAWQEAAKKKEADEAANPTRRWVSAFARTAALAADPHRPGRILRTDWWGAWLSEDGDAGWKEIDRGTQNTVVSDLVLGPDGTLYAATMDNGLLATNDHGKTYRCIFPVSSNERALHGHVWRVRVLKSGRIVATSSPWDRSLNQVVLSDDGGKTYRIVKAGLPSARPKKNTVWQEGYARAIAEDPFSPNTLYLGIDGDGGGLFVSGNGGESWKKAPGQPASNRVYNGLACDPEKQGRIFWGSIGAEGGVYRSDDGARTWKRVLKEMRDVYDIAAGGGKVWASGRDEQGPALYVSSDGGNGWKRAKSVDGPGFAEALIAFPDGSAVAGVTRGFRKAGAQLWQVDAEIEDVEELSQGLPESEGFAAAAWDASAGILYAGRSGDGIYRIDWRPAAARPPTGNAQE